MGMHVPVLLHEIITTLDPKPGEFFIDGTLGGGGHAEAIIERLKPDGIFLGIDWDRETVEQTGQRIKDKGLRRTTVEHGNYADILRILAEENLPQADGVLLDLGVSLDELETSGRGFSFRKNEPLDMRYDAGSGRKTAAETVNSFPEKELAEIVWRYGEERNARRIARAIREARRKKPIETTHELRAVIEEVMPRRGKLHPATKTFMALRIFVNGELENLQSFMSDLEKTVKTGGRIAVISFHSLEDRIVKNRFRDLAQSGKAERITKKPIRPSAEEKAKNPRSRSAKLRAIRFVDGIFLNSQLTTDLT